MTLIETLKLFTSPSMSGSSSNGESYIGWQKGEGLSAIERVEKAKEVLKEYEKGGVK